MPWWVIITYPDKKNLRRRGPYSVSGRADQKVDEAEEEGLIAEKYETKSWNPAEAAIEIKEQRVDEIGYEEGSRRFRLKEEADV